MLVLEVGESWLQIFVEEVRGEFLDCDEGLGSELALSMLVQSC